MGARRTAASALGSIILFTVGGWSTAAPAGTPVAGPERPVSSPAYGPAEQQQLNPSIASDGTNFFTVWVDSRFDPGRPDVSFINVYGTRISASGEVLDPAGIRISAHAGVFFDASATVAWDGSNYLVVWQDGRRISGSRVTPGGAVLDPGGFPITPDAAGAAPRDPVVVWNGTSYLVTWFDFRAGTGLNIFGARVTKAGTVLDPAGIQISNGPGIEVLHAVSGGGPGFLVAWSVGDQLLGARIDRAGTVLDPSGLRLAPSGGAQVSIAWDGQRFFVAYADSRSPSDPSDVFGTRVTSAGVVLDPAGIPLATGAGLQTTPSVTWNGSHFLVAYFSLTDVYTTRVTSAGVLLDPVGVPLATDPVEPRELASAWNGSRFFVVWEDHPDPVSFFRVSDIQGIAANSDGRPLGTASIDVATSANTQRAPDIAFDGTNFFVVWQDFRGDTYDIYGARVTSDGQMLDGAGIAISSAANEQQNPAVAFDGTNFLVVWDDTRSDRLGDVYAARVTRGGRVLDPAGIPVSAAPNNEEVGPDVAWNGSRFLVVWLDGRRATGLQVFGARLDGQGTVLDPAGRTISDTLTIEGAAAVASDGSGFLVVWQRFRSFATRYDVMAARVGGDGTLLDPRAILVSGVREHQRAPAVAWNRSTYLVVWEDLRSGGSDIYAARVSPVLTFAGLVLDRDGIPISTAPGDQNQPAVGVSSRALVAWHEGTHDAVGDIRGKRLDAKGATVDPAPFPIAASADPQFAPSVAARPGAGFGVVYDRQAPEPPLGAIRAFLRTVAPR